MTSTASRKVLFQGLGKVSKARSGRCICQRAWILTQNKREALIPYLTCNVDNQDNLALVCAEVQILPVDILDVHNKSSSKTRKLCLFIAQKANSIEKAYSIDFLLQSELYLLRKHEAKPEA